MKFNDMISNLKASIKDLLTADNAKEIASLDHTIDALVEAHESTLTELDEAKNTLLDFVKTTSFKEPSKEVPQPPQDDRSLDEIMNDELNNLKEEN